MIVLVLVFVLVPRDHPIGYLVLWSIIEITIAFVCFGTISIFLNWKKRFPFVAFSGQTTSRTRSDGGKMVSVELEEEHSIQEPAAN